MKIRGLTWRAYRIPFRRRFANSREVLTWREGLIVRLAAGEAFGLGEVSPLEPQALSVSRAMLAELEPRLIGRDLQAASAAVAEEGVAAAAVRCGLDIAVCDLMARAAGLSVAAYLGGQPRPVAVNATIALSEPASAAAAALEAVEQGFATIKLKVGMMGSAGAERERVAAVRKAIGARARLRLDANRAWSLEQANATLSALAGFDIEYVEEPVASERAEDLAAVRRTAQIPIAADESLCSLQTAERLLALDAADVWVLKPMVLGGLRPAMAIARLAEQNGVDTVVTTTLDSGVAVAAALHLAAAIGTRRACGLATAALLASGLVAPAQEPRAGMMICPATPGLSVEIDEQEAAPYLEAV